MNPKNSTIGDLADAVLAQVEREQLGVSPDVSYTKRASISTEIGNSMVKVAARVREAADTSLSYDDLERFLNRHGLR